MTFLLLALLISNIAFAEAQIRAEFPTVPDSNITPGSLCDRPDNYRYGEQIPYCDRDSMEKGIKEIVFQEYRNRGYILSPENRDKYKIDHLIPLCAGGSNQESNLWPQHISLYLVTDPIEPLGCEKLKAGKIKQSDLIRMIISSKKNLRLVPSTLKFLNSL